MYGGEYISKHIFIFEDVDEVSDNYHKEGGVIFVASNREEVEDMAKLNGNILLTSEDWKEVKIFTICNCNDSEKKSEVFVFPDAGCC